MRLERQIIYIKKVPATDYASLFYMGGVHGGNPCCQKKLYWGKTEVYQRAPKVEKDQDVWNTVL